MATRIKILSPGSVQFSAIIHQDNLGKVESEPSSSREADGSSGTGKILYELNGLNLEIPLHANDCDLRQFPHKGDIVRYVIIYYFLIISKYTVYFRCYICNFSYEVYLKSDF